MAARNAKPAIRLARPKIHSIPAKNHLIGEKTGAAAMVRNSGELPGKGGGWMRVRSGGRNDSVAGSVEPPCARIGSEVGRGGGWTGRGGGWTGSGGGSIIGCTRNTYPKGRSEFRHPSPRKKLPRHQHGNIIEGEVSTAWPDSDLLRPRAAVESIGLGRQRAIMAPWRRGLIGRRRGRGGTSAQGRSS